MQQSMQAHMADLEAELVIKESQLRTREVCLLDCFVLWV
jgi:hypothetical protein